MRALYIDEAVNTCDCCGKAELKFTVAMETESGSLVHFGRVCAARNSGKKARAIRTEIKADEAARIRAARDLWAKHPAYLAARARFAERDALNRQSSTPLLGIRAADFVREAASAAEAARALLASQHRVHKHHLM